MDKGIDKGVVLLVGSILALVLAAGAFFVGTLIVSAPLAILGSFGLISLKAFYRVVQPNEAHVRMFQHKKEIFIARPGAKLSYFELPVVMQVIVLPLAVFKTEIENYSFEDKNFAPFKATVVPYFVIDNPEIASERVSGSKELHDQLEKVVLSVSRATMLKYTIKEIMSDRQKIGGLIEEEVSIKLKEFGVNLKNFELVDIMDEEKCHVIRDLNLAEESRISSDSRKVQAEKNSEARFVEAKRDEDAQKREIERDRQVGVAQQLKDEEIAKKKQDAIRAVKQAVEIETVRQKEIDKKAADLTGQATAVQKIKVAEGTKQSKMLEADGEAAYIDRTGKAEGDKVKYAGQGKAAGILAEAEAMQKYDSAAKYIKGLVVKQAIQEKYAGALTEAELKVFLTGKPDKGIMGLLTPEGGAQIGQALATYNETKGDSSGLIDLLSDKFNIPKEVIENFLGQGKKKGGKKPSSSKQ